MLAGSRGRLTNLLFYGLSLKAWSPSLRCLSFSASLEIRGRRRGRDFSNPSVIRNQSWEEDSDHFDSLEDFINQSGVQEHGRRLQEKTEALLHSYTQQQQKRVKKKILERKYFKKPQEVNLLTWNAKQQIQFLHDEFPDEWTPEHLAESFPISVEGVHRLLRSSYTPRSEQEIAKHDRRVMSHWRQLKETLTLDTRPLEESQTSKFQFVINAAKLPLMINAGGSLTLPAPRTSNKQLQKGGKRMGLFESIVAGSEIVKTQEGAEQKQIEERKGEEIKLLKEIARFQKGKRKEIPAYFSDQSKPRR